MTPKQGPARFGLDARIVHLPLYAAGVPKLRTLVFLVSLVGLGLAIKPLFAW